MPRHQVLQLITAIAWLQGASMSQAAPTIAKPGCNDTCGNIMIPYPFGIGPGCANSSWFEIFCNHSTSPPRPFLQRLNLEVMNMMLDELSILVLVVATQPLRVCAGEAAESSRPVSSIDLDGSPYRFSGYSNALYAQFVTGCEGSVVMTNRSNQVAAACASVCSDNNSITSNTCFGVGCCQSSISNKDYDYLTFSFYKISFSNEAVVQKNTCMDAGLVMLSQYQYLLDPQNLTRTPSPDNFPAILELNIEGSASCPYPYEGNGYDPSLCKFPRACNKCKGICDVLNQDDGGWPIHVCRKNTLESIAPIVGSMGGIGLLSVAISSYLLYRSMKRRKEIRKRAKYFKKNGGFLLQREIAQEDMEKTRTYTTDELEKATDKFNKNRILGKGGQGTVYKGMLPDGRIVAIKKSNQVVSDQLEQFINEVVILSQINHRNIVKLLGCCLETKVPLLVYEFIPNGTLAQHIQDPAQDFRISWKTRLQIAMETSGALSYLHSSSAAFLSCLHQK
ncbi:Wall-associated receptor kinase-like 2-like protein [Drosera capensis]